MSQRLVTVIILVVSVSRGQVSVDNMALESQHFPEYTGHNGHNGFQQARSSCHTEYDHVTVVKQVPTFSKHCTNVDETKCKTIFKNSFSTAMETQCSPTFDTSCGSTLNTAYKQECKTIKDVECRIVNLEDHSGGHYSKKICEDVPTEKCVPVPVKVEGQKCVNIPTQTCETVPVTANNPVPKKQCYKKPRKVCQTLVSTKPKVVTAKVPKEVCDHSAALDQHRSKPKLSVSGIRPSPKLPQLSSSNTQTASESAPMVHIQKPRLNPNNKLEDLYTHYSQDDSVFREEAQMRQSEKNDEDIILEDISSIANSQNAAHFL